MRWALPFICGSGYGCTTCRAQGRVINALKGEEELGRLVAQTSQREIEALMNVALAASTA